MDNPTLFLSKTGYRQVKATTNANMTGPVTSVGNATSIADSIALPGSPTTTTQSLGTGNTTIATTEFVVQEIDAIDTSDVLYDPDLFINSPTAVTLLQEVINKVWATGIITGGTLTDNGDGTIKIATGEAAIRTTADGAAPIYLAKFNEQTPINLTDDATNYVYLDYNSGSPQFAVSTSEGTADEYTKIPAYEVHRDGNTLKYIDIRKNNVDGKKCTNCKFRSFTKFLHEEGGSVIGEPSNLTISLTAGSFRYRSSCGDHVAFDTSNAGTANANVFTHYHRNGSGWTTTTDQKLIDTTLWDNDQAVPTVLGNNRYGVSWVFVINNTPSSLAVVMGQEEYLNLAAARIANIPSSLPSVINGLGALVGFVICKKNTASFDAIQSAFTQTFSTSTPTVHNGLSGLQGGTIDEYYHLTSAEYTSLQLGGHKKKIIGFSAVSPATGQQVPYIVFPVAGTITAWNIIANAGTATVKVWKRTAGTTAPAIADVINTAGVSLSSGTAIQSTTLTDFTTTSVAANDMFAFDLTAVAGATNITFELEITVS